MNYALPLLLQDLLGSDVAVVVNRTLDEHTLGRRDDACSRKIIIGLSNNTLVNHGLDACCAVITIFKHVDLVACIRIGDITSAICGEINVDIAGIRSQLLSGSPLIGLLVECDEIELLLIIKVSEDDEECAFWVNSYIYEEVTVIVALKAEWQCVSTYGLPCLCCCIIFFQTNLIRTWCVITRPCVDSAIGSYLSSE